MRNKKGFTLIELLAVIVILGLLMAIAIPSVTKYITQSRKKTLVNSIDSFITAASTAVNNNEFGALSDQNIIYYIPVSNLAADSCISLEKGGTDPFGHWKEAYVAVNYDAEKYSYDYFFTFYDDAGYGMALTKSDDIKPSGDNQIVNPTPVNADNITNQKGGRATTTKVLGVGTCNSSSAVQGGSGDNTAPVVSGSAVGSDYSITMNLNFSSLDAGDYPVTVEYYYKVNTDTSYTKAATISVTSGSPAPYEYIGLRDRITYDVKAVVKDKSGNSSEVVYSSFVYCFLAGTKVLTENGLMNIEDVKLGDMVYSLNIDTNAKELKKVTKLIRSTTDEIYEIKIGDQLIKVTPRHEFYIVDKGWIRAYELEVGDKLVSTSNGDMEIKTIEHKYLDDKVETYNLTVDDNHNYLITEYRLLVHNASSPT